MYRLPLLAFIRTILASEELEYKISDQAVDALKEAAEWYLTSLFEGAQLVAYHYGHQWLNVDAMAYVLMLWELGGMESDDGDVNTDAKEMEVDTEPGQASVTNREAGGDNAVNDTDVQSIIDSLIK
jgi:histone H3/H4